MSKKILVTGAGGFIGRHVARELMELGHEVLCLDRAFEEGDYWMRNQYFLDISNYEKLRSTIKEDVDIIFHLAAQSTGSISMEDPEKDIDWNAKGTLNICRLAREKNVETIIYTSTMAVYGNGSWKKETDKLNPLSNYGVSKLTGEFYVKSLQQYGINHTIYRLWNTYGPGQNMENPRNGIVSCYLQQALEGKEINVTGSFDRFRDLVYIDDTVSAILTGLQPAADNDVFNICNKREVSVQEMIDGILETHDLDALEFNVTNVGGHDGDQSGSSGDNEKLIGIGWKPKTTYGEGIKKFYNYEKQKRKNNRRNTN